MKHGYFKAAATAPELRVADCDFNLARILESVETARRLGAGILVLPELCITGSTCGDLFLHRPLINAARDSLLQLAQKAAAIPMLIIAGLPVAHMGVVYNCAAVLLEGRVLGLASKTALGGFETGARCFSPAPREKQTVWLSGEAVPMGQGLLFQNALAPELVLGVEIGGDSRLPCPPHMLLCAGGASVIAAPAATPESIFAGPEGESYSRSGLCGYISAGAGHGESTTDYVFAGRCGIYECGETLDSLAPFEGGMAVCELDLERIAFERARVGAPVSATGHTITFELRAPDIAPARRFSAAPFIPREADGWRRVLDIQSAGLAKRMAHTGSKTAVIGVSGGLDSTLALIAAHKAFERLGRNALQITAVTMPCFGTSGKTLNNARRLCSALDIPLMEIDITAAVRLHLSDIGHSGAEVGAAFENAQARERTQVLMNLANMHGGLVVGTGDMSELALGWATYNGDHMSMYGVNAGVPKTLVRHVLERFAANCGSAELRDAVIAVLETPVSPELLPLQNGQIAQITEDLVGPYELHDFFLYHMLAWGYGPKKLLEAATVAFGGAYDAKTVRRWLGVFVRRFFAQQFKRSCLPDGPSVCGLSLSPRGGLQMPSDASMQAWAHELDGQNG